MKNLQTKLSPRAEKAIEQGKEENRELREFMGIGLKKGFEKQLRIRVKG
jgi:hypothetical protein